MLRVACGPILENSAKTKSSQTSLEFLICHKCRGQQGRQVKAEKENQTRAPGVAGRVQGKLQAESTGKGWDLLYRSFVLS